MSHNHTRVHKNVTPYQPGRGIKIKEKVKSALETAVGASQAGCCPRCADQVQWCVAQRSAQQRSRADTRFQEAEVWQVQDAEAAHEVARARAANARSPLTPLPAAATAASSCS